MPKFARRVRLPRRPRPPRLSECFRRLRALPAGSPQHSDLRSYIVRRCLPLVRYVARGFADRGVPQDELFQVGSEALVIAVDRFEPERGSGFSAYAYPTVAGAMKRYFRDFCWSIRPSRRLQELRTDIVREHPALTQRLGHSPNAAEIADEFGTTAEEVQRALEASETYSLSSLDQAPPDGPGEDLTMYEAVGGEDPDLLLVEDRESLAPAMRSLPRRERMILLLRFYGNRTQREIAEELGLSQMHVSRLLRQTCGRLRRALTAEA